MMMPTTLSIHEVAVISPTPRFFGFCGWKDIIMRVTRQHCHMALDMYYFAISLPQQPHFYRNYYHRTETTISTIQLLNLSHSTKKIVKEIHSRP